MTNNYVLENSFVFSLRNSDGLLPKDVKFLGYTEGMRHREHRVVRDYPKVLTLFGRF